MRLTIPSDQDAVPGTQYKGFVPIEPSDSRANTVKDIESRRLLLVWPVTALLNTNRQPLNDRGIILGIGLAFALKEHPGAIPRQFKDNHDGEPVKIITSTRMLSRQDNRIYLAYFYINEKGEVVTSFIAEKPWASMCPSPAIKAP
jgi:hypothetical protein